MTTLGIRIAYGRLVLAVVLSGCVEQKSALRPSANATARMTGSPPTLDLRAPMALGARAILPRLDPDAGFRPWFMLRGHKGLPTEPRHDTWDVGDMTGRYLESLILARRLTGIPIDSREQLLRSYLAGLFDPKDGLCYTRGTEWTPRRACLFSQSSAMLGLLSWYRETGSTEARRLLDQHVAGVMRRAVTRSDYACFPKYEWDGER